MDHDLDLTNRAMKGVPVPLLRDLCWVHSMGEIKCRHRSDVDDGVISIMCQAIDDYDYEQESTV